MNFDHEVTIKILPKIKDFLDRYYDNTIPLADRFMHALSEGSIILHGKGFCLAHDKAEEIKEEIREAQERAREESDQDYLL